MTLLLRSRKTQIQRAIAVLRRYGTNAHVYLPGIGVLNGLQAGNYLDSALTTPGTIDNPVGGVVDAIGVINATQPTTASKPILRRGAVNLLTYSHDFTNLGIGSGVSATASSVTFASGAGSRALKAAMYQAAGYTLAFQCSPSDVGKQFYLGVWESVLDGLTTGRSPLKVVPADGIVVFNITSSGGVGYAGIINDGTGYTLTNPAFALFQGTYTAAQIQALGGIPLTTTAPASTSLGPYWFDTSGGKSLSATFAAGNESVTVIDAAKTGQVTSLAQNVVGTYNINTDTSGRIIVNGSLSAPDLTVLQSLANRMAGL